MIRTNNGVIYYGRLQNSVYFSHNFDAINLIISCGCDAKYIFRFIASIVLHRKQSYQSMYISEISNSFVYTRL